MGYEIGQRMPLDMDAAAFGAQISPQWYILLSSPQKEPGAQARLTQMGVPNAGTRPKPHIGASPAVGASRFPMSAAWLQATCLSALIGSHAGT